MTSKKPGQTPGTDPGPDGPAKLAAKVAEVAMNPEAYAPVFDVYRVPPNGDARFTAYAGDIPRGDFVNGAARWCAATLGAGTWRIDVKDASRVHAGSVLVPIAVDQRPPELRTQVAAAPTTTTAAPAGGGFDMAAVMVAMIQAQSSQQTVMMQAMMNQNQNKGDDLDRLLKLRELTKPEAPPPSSSASETLKLGLEIGRKLADKNEALVFLQENADKVLDVGGTVAVEAFKFLGDLLGGKTKKPVAAQIVDATATTPTPPPAPTPAEPVTIEVDAETAADNAAVDEVTGQKTDAPPPNEAANG